jgi:MinD-like ATPase involved in chromosome partitioning or flagellar assembly
VYLLGTPVKPGKASVIAFVSGKGGAGKSVIIGNLSACLAKNGMKVLMIDCDFFTRGLTFYMIGDKSAKAGLLEFLSDGTSVSEFKTALEVSVKDTPNLSLLPASSKTRMYSVSDLDQRANLTVLQSLRAMYHDFQELINLVRADYDYIILDTRSGVDPVSLLPALVADEFILIVEEDKTSWRIGELLISEIKKLEQFLQSLTDSVQTHFKGFVLNKVTEEIPLDFVRDYLEKRVLGGKCLLQIPLERAVPMAFKDDKLVVRQSPSSVFSRKIRVMEDIITGQIEREEREKGVKGRFLEFYTSNETVLIAVSYFTLIFGAAASGFLEPTVVRWLYVILVIPVAVFLATGILYRAYKIFKRK